MFGSIMCSFIAFLSRVECQASRITLCRHTDDLSTILTLSNLFGDCEAYGVWPTKRFHSMLLWLLCFLSRVFLERVKATVLAETSRTIYFLANINFFYSSYQKFLICLATHRIFSTSHDGERIV